jgi:hypothetical protein
MLHEIVMTSLLAVSTPAAEVASNLQLPVQIQASGQPLDVQRDGHSAPFVGDFDGDGVRDLLVGQYDQGRLRLYRNAGTNTEPLFQDYDWLKAEGELATVPTSCCVGFTPQLVDLDGDHLLDILSGSYPGEVYYFRRKRDGTYAAGQQLVDTAGKAINAGYAATAFAVDWDANGTLDLLLGNIKGEVYVARLGRQALTFEQPEKLTAAGEPIEAPGGDSAPVAADWDGDGRLDLIVGSGHGSVLWFRNAGTSREPKLESTQILVGESPLGWGDDEKRAPHDWGLRVKPCVVDWNGDGLLDLLLGDRCGGFQAEPTQTVTEKEDERQANDRLPELRRNWAATFAEFRQLQSAPPEGSGAARLAAVRDRLASLKDEIARVQEVQEQYQPGRQSHGFVWLFLRKANP